MNIITEFPRAWELEASFDLNKQYDGEDNSEIEDADEFTNPPAQDTEALVPVTSSSHSKAYHEFLQFLELGCSGSPLQGYPTVLIILSTIPSSVCYNFSILTRGLFTKFSDPPSLFSAPSLSSCRLLHLILGSYRWSRIERIGARIYFQGISLRPP